MIQVPCDKICPNDNIHVSTYIDGSLQGPRLIFQIYSALLATSAQHRDTSGSSPQQDGPDLESLRRTVRGEAEEERLREVRGSLLIIVPDQQNDFVSIVILQTIDMPVSV